MKKMTKAEFDARTKMQRDSNRMLFMRRAMKFLAIAIRIDIWMQWMDCEVGDPGPEPHLEEGDINAYLYANGHTEAGIAAGLAEVMKIVENAKKGSH